MVGTGCLGAIKRLDRRICLEPPPSQESCNHVVSLFISTDLHRLPSSISTILHSCRAGTLSTWQLSYMLKGRRVSIEVTCTPMMELN